MSYRATALVIEDHEATAAALEILLSLHDIHTLHAATESEGLQILGSQTVDLVLQDMNFSEDTTSGEEGKALFKTIREGYPDLPVILLTAWTDVSAAVDLVKAGAVDYVPKPWDDRRLVATVETLLELRETRRQLAQDEEAAKRRKSNLSANYTLGEFIYQDPATEAVVAMACQVARSDVPVLITGPSGSGKEQFAEMIQKNSSVASGPFISVDCGALPSELIEAELFGAEEGAYTGANRNREGKFEAANNGTLFLDEIGNLSLSAQMKLLRVLETGRFSRLGSNREQSVKVRVISATNADLLKEIQSGQFREDLYYRINVIELKIPGLRERPKDILPLAKAFLPPDTQLSALIKKQLQSYGWPGNVRELRNTMQRAVLLAGSGPIEPEHLRLIGAPSPAPRAAAPSPELDAKTVQTALTHHRGVVSKAAQDLGISRQALYRLMSRYNIQRSS